MPLYEHVFLLRQELSEADVTQVTEQIINIVKAHGGDVSKVENWGLKSLAYRIKKNRKAHYALVNIDAPSLAINEIERQHRVNEDILRFITIRVTELEAGSSAVLRQRESSEKSVRAQLKSSRQRREGSLVVTIDPNHPWPEPKT